MAAEEKIKLSHCAHVKQNSWKSTARGLLLSVPTQTWLSIIYIIKVL